MGRIILFLCWQHDDRRAPRDAATPHLVADLFRTLFICGFMKRVYKCAVVLILGWVLLPLWGRERRKNLCSTLTVDESNYFFWLTYTEQCQTVRVRSNEHNLGRESQKFCPTEIIYKLTKKTTHFASPCESNVTFIWNQMQQNFCNSRLKKLLATRPNY